MKKRVLYGTAIVLLAISVVLVVWLGSFNPGEYGPSDPQQTFLFWALFTLIVILMVTLGFILVRTGVKLYVERQSNREGSRIKTKLVVGALALSFMPAFFLVLFSYLILNVNLQRWLLAPGDAERRVFIEMEHRFTQELGQQAELQAALLAHMPETLSLVSHGTRAPGFLQRFSKEQDLDGAAILPAGGTQPLDSFGPYPIPPTSERAMVARVPIQNGNSILGYAIVSSRLPVDLAREQNAIDRYHQHYLALHDQRQNILKLSMMFMALITLFVLYVATWIALFLSRKISGPISALLTAAGEVRKGNLRHRVDIRATDELASLVRGFNEMTEELDANSRELDARRRFTEAILESIPTGVMSITADGRIQRVNRALTQIFSPGQVAKAQRLGDLFPAEEAADLRYLMKRARRTGVASRQLELKVARQTLHLAVTVSALEEKMTSGFVVVLEDTSELLRAQKTAAWHEVARRVAHEIKNPLTPIALSAERIIRQLDRLALPPDNSRIIGECAATISQSVESVKALVDEFSQYARFPAAHPARCDLNEVVEAALSVFAGRLDGIEIQTQLAQGLPPVNLDMEQFKRVVVNLVDNAAEAMQDSLVKKLFVVTQAGAADTVELVITDTGCGVTPEDREKLFLPYFSTKGRGTGLGLAIVNHILADHNATIRVEDNQPAGARFIVEVPVAVEAEVAVG
jgi:two-component system, NtrC family, nitrogen regulation sensor histidine kinase NtrY